MSTFAYKDEFGQIVFSDDGVVTVFPSENGDTPGHTVLADWLSSGGEIAESAPARPLSDVKDQLIAEINAAAEGERLKYITAGEGQAMTYTEKLAQARAFLAASAPDPADYPMIANEVDITAADAASVAEAVVSAYSAWAAIGAAIEKTRMEANKSITAATDAPAARAIRNNVVWPKAD